MSTATPFVMFGHNHLIGDFAEIVQANGGHLARIVQNMEEQPIEGRKVLQDRLPAIAEAQEGVMTEVIRIESFEPGVGEKFIIGFSGFQMRPLRDRLREEFSLDFETLIHPSAMVSPSAEIAPGCIINAGCIIASGVRLRAHAFINRATSIGHDTEISPYSVVQPAANIAGYVRVGEGAVIGIGATVIENLHIGHHAKVAAGAVVTADVAPGMLVAGVPAREIKRIHPA